MDLPRGDCLGDPLTPAAPRLPRGLCSAASPERPSVRAGSRTLPPRSFSRDHRPSIGGRSQVRSTPRQAVQPGLRTCALEQSPYPSPSTTIRSRALTGLLPFSISRHLAEPALRASSSFHLFP